MVMSDRSKEKWHYARVGTGMPASLSKGIKHGYEAELKERGVHDKFGNTTPIGRKEDHSQQPMNFTKVLNVGHDDPNVKTGAKVDLRSHGFAFRD